MYRETAVPRVEAVPCEDILRIGQGCYCGRWGGGNSTRWGRGGGERRYRERERTVRERESIVEAVPRERTYCAGEGEGERRYRERERTVREREPIIEAVPRERTYCA